ncbi:MAG: hypothetical protein JWM68_494, partial [Verrucomicrobiales bacterium]|nr:hypothetical protein [Verrucomicrobiales bacterium]
SSIEIENRIVLSLGYMTSSPLRSVVRFLGFYLFLTVGLAGALLHAQAPSFQWVKPVGGISNEFSFAIAADAGGNNYSAAWFYSPTMKVDSVTLTNHGTTSDIYLVKRNASGNLLWARNPGGTGADTAIAVAADDAGNCFVTGSFTGPATFGATNLAGAGSGDIFVAKYDSAGEVVWAIQAGGTDYETGHGIALDGSGNIYVSGHFSGVATFESTNLTSRGGLDAFVAKYTPNGGLLWVQQLGGTTDDYGYRIAVNAAGTSHVVGTFFSPVLTARNLSVTNNGVRDIFLAELSADGAVNWLRGAGGASDDQGFNIAVDQSGNSYITGFFKTTANFGGNISVTSRGNWDAFLAKYDSSGNALFATNMGGGLNDYGNGIAIDSAGSIYVSGTYYGISKFGDVTLNSPFLSDIFLVKFNSSGSVLNVWKAGGDYGDDGQGIAADAKGNIYLTGYCEWIGYFGGLSYQSQGGYDAFVTKLQTEFYPVKEPFFDLARGAGSGTNDHSFGIALDTAGNSYVTGIFFDTATFGPSNLVSRGAGDVFLAKYSPTGNLIWLKQAGSINGLTNGSSGDVGYRVTLDATNGVFITGYFSGTIDFGKNLFNQSVTLSSSGRNETFIAKYTCNGTVIWASRSGGAYHDTGLQVRTDAAGSAFMCGFFREVATFGTHTLTAAASSPSNLRSDMYLAKYDADGSNVWAVGGGGSGDDVSYDFDFDSAGNILVSGYFENTAIFSGINLTSAGGHDIFLAKYSPTGTLLWINQAGGAGVEIGRAVAVDAAGNSFVTGNFQSTISIGNTNLTSAGSDDVFLAKYSAAGSLLWAKKAGGTGSDIANAIVIDRQGNLYVAGTFTGTATFDGRVLTASDMDIFVACYDANGALLWIKQAGGSGADEVNSLALDENGRVLMTGYFSDTAKFDSISLTSYGSNDIFYARLGEVPRLSTSRVGNRMVLAWPTLATDFVLQYNTVLGISGWNNVSQPAETTNGVYTVTDDIQGNRFYRLGK